MRGETRVIVHEQRPVPLWQHVQVGTRMFDLFGADDGHTVDAGLLRHVADRTRYLDPIPGRRGGRGPGRGNFGGWRPPDRPDVIARLDREGLLPAITFIFSRAGCDAAARQCVLAGMWLTTEDERARDRRGRRRAHRRGAARGPRRAGLLGVARRAWRRGGWRPTTPD